MLDSVYHLALTTRTVPWRRRASQASIGSMRAWGKMMGVFFEAELAQPKVREAIRDALETDPRQVQDTAGEVAKRANAVADDIRQGTKFQSGRFLLALAVFVAIVLAAVVTDALKLETSPEALFGLAGTILGLVVGFLGGEKPGN
jgi:hypothetical protein